MANVKLSKTVLITGGGAGIGLEIARKFDQSSYQVIICGRDQERLNSAVGSFGSDSSAVGVQCDVTKEEQIASLAKFIEEEYGYLNVLVNNVGSFHLGNIIQASQEQFRGVVDTNLFGPFLMTKAFLPLIKVAEYGRVVNITTSYAEDMQAHPQFGLFAAANAALLSMTRTLAVELAGARITVNSVGPGMIESDSYSQRTQDNYSGIIPHGRLGEASEVASAVKYLADPKNGYITGVHLPVSGGWQGESLK